MAKNVGSSSFQSTTHDEIYRNLTRLGGAVFKEEDIVFEGNRMVLPVSFKNDLAGAISFLEQKAREEEDLADFTRTFNYRPHDGAYNAYRAMKEVYGIVQGITVRGFFGDQPPRYIQIPTDVDVTEEVPWGQFALPGFKNTTINFGSAMDPEYGPVFRVLVQSPRKNRAAIEGLFVLLEKAMKEGSIYRGKPIDGSLNFIDLSGVNPDKVVYSEQVRAELEANVWAFMERTEMFTKMGMSSKRSVLMYGKYGTGKSLTANVTALRARKAGWTFIMSRPGRDDFHEVMQTARLYQPAVVFVEDAEQFASDTNNDVQLSKILDTFDGISSKSTKMMIVMTTNHPERLTPGMRRPGRIDQFIGISDLDPAGIQKLIEITIGERLDANIDWSQVHHANDGYTPAFVKEAADRSLRYAIARGADVKDVRINTADLVHAAQSMREQYEWTIEHINPREDSLGVVFKGIVSSAIAEVASEDPRDDVWDAEKLVQAIQAAI